MLPIFALLALAVLAAVLIGIIHDKNVAINKLLYQDPLTGYWNFNRFCQKAQKTLSNDKLNRYALVYMDIDHFKYVNDMYGTNEGDYVLKCLSDILYQQLGKKELFARISKDNFAVFLQYDGTEENLRSRVDKIDERIQQLSEGIKKYRIIVSGGVYVFTAEKNDINIALTYAGYAREQAKDAYKNNFIMYEDKLRKAIITEKQLEPLMYNALRYGEFVAYFQPKFTIVERKLIGAEALVRWNRPNGQVIPPDSFVPTFERNGFIINIDFYIFESVCAAIRRWIDMGKTPVTVSSNFSRLHIANPQFAEKLTQIVNKYEVPIDLLEIEVTETVATDDIISFERWTQQLKKNGFKISLDDFGSGYSSLGVLRKLTIDSIKLDKSFIDDDADEGPLEAQKKQILVDSIVSFAHRMGMYVICEGIETEEQAKMLVSLDCKLGQGYLFSKPLPLKDFEKLLSDNCENQGASTA